MERSYRYFPGMKRDHGLSVGDEECSSEIDSLRTSKERPRTFCRTARTQQSDQHCADITRDHTRSAGRRECNSQIDIVQTSNNITYNLQQGENVAVRLTFWRYQTPSRTFCRSGKNAAVRPTLWRYRKRSRTVYRRGEPSSQIDILQTSKRSRTSCRRGRMQQSDQHCGAIRRDHVRPAGGGRTQQSDPHSGSLKQDHIQSTGWEVCSNQIHILQISNEITYGL